MFFFNIFLMTFFQVEPNVHCWINTVLLLCIFKYIALYVLLFFGIYVHK